MALNMALALGDGLEVESTAEVGEVTRYVRLECGLSIVLGVVASVVLNCRMLQNFLDRFRKSKSFHIIIALKKS